MRKVVLVTYNSFLPHLTVREHLEFGAKFNKSDSIDIQQILEEFNLSKTTQVGKLSLGNKSKVSLLTAFLARPELIMIDEIFSNIDEKESFMKKYKEMSRSYGIDVIYTTQHLEDTKIADLVYLMKDGKSERFIKRSM